MLNKLKCSWVQILWIMLISLVCLLTFVSGKFSYKQFLANDITEVRTVGLTKSQKGTEIKDGSYTITEDTATFRYNLPVTGVYKFLEVDLQNLSVDELPVLYYGEFKGEQRDLQNFVLRDGKNFVYLGEKKINKIVMVIQGKKDASFVIKKIKLDENVPRCSKKKAVVLYVLIFCVVFALFLGVKMLLGNWFRRIWIKPQNDVMQTYSNLVENLVFSKYKLLIGKKQLIHMRRGVFWFLIAYMLVVSETALLTRRYYAWHVLIISVLLILQSFLYYERNGRSVVWNRKICMPFLCFAVWICIANGMAYKALYSGVGWFLLLVVLLFGYSIATMNRFYTALEDVSYAMAGTYPLVLLVSAFLRPRQEGMIYTGVFRTPEHFAEYLILLLLVFQFLYTQTVKSKMMNSLLWIGLISAELLLIGTQQWLYILISIGSFICWKKFQHKGAMPVKRILLSAVAAVCMLFIVQNLSAWMHLDEIWKSNQLQAKNNILYYVSREAYQSFWLQFQQRCQIWRAYLRKINVFGHGASLSLAGKKVRPENDWISLIFKYGIVGFAFYLVMEIRCLYTGFCRWKKRQNGAEFFLLELQAVCCILGCYSGFEMPFVAFLWIMFYLGIGYYLTE